MAKFEKMPIEEIVQYIDGRGKAREAVIDE